MLAGLIVLALLVFLRQERDALERKHGGCENA